MNTRNKQSGVALITAVLIIALAVTAAVTIAANYQLNFHRTENAFNSGQAWAYAKGAEEWAMAILARDQEDNTHDAYDSDNAWWNNGEPLLFPLPNGFIEGQLVDAQGKINLNTLHDGTNVDIKSKERLERLFDILGIDRGLVGAIIDWIDPDQQFTGSLGAEADIYIGLEPPYLPADQPMQDISELRLVHGIDEEIYTKLLPHVTVLDSTSAILNLNTASAEVLESIAIGPPLGIGEELVTDREKEPFKQNLDIENAPSIKGRGIQFDFHDTGYGTNHFILNTKCVIGKSQVRMLSLIHRGAGNNLTVIKRSQKI